jgi:hypothetical protein
MKLLLSNMRLCGSASENWFSQCKTPAIVNETAMVHDNLLRKEGFGTSWHFNHWFDEL